MIGALTRWRLKPEYRRALSAACFGKELNASPSQFVERVRIDQARRALLETEAQIENVAIRCGFGSLRRMDRAFSRTISATPTEFRARFKAPGAPG